MGKGHVLIVDDEESIVRTLSAVLHDEGFDVLCARDGNEALSLIRTTMPDVVLLDIWLPGTDGIEILEGLRRMCATTEVIVMSGHGNIETAVRVTKLGAFDYLEKPFSLERVLGTVYRALERRVLPDGNASSPLMLPSTTHHLPSPLHHNGKGGGLLGRKAGDNAGQESAPDGSKWRQGRGVRQRKQQTLCRSMVLYGQGLQSGLKTGIILSPLPPHSGIVFGNITTGETVLASVDCVESTDFCTSLRKGRMAVKTVEHLMSALHAYGITNLLIKVSDEVPIMDGSAVGFCRLIEEAGIEEQDAIVEEFVVDCCYHIGERRLDTKFIMVEPYDGFRVTYRLSYPNTLGVQEVVYEHRGGAGYRQEVAPARTFAFVKEVEKMHEMGLVAGGRLNNVILLDEERIINSTQPRFADEFARHKVLDIMGDLYLLGKFVRGHVQANMTGHTENVALGRQLRQSMLASSSLWS